MKRYRQWLAEQQNHMTESPDGEYYLVIEADAALAEKDKQIAISKALEAKFFPQKDAYRIVERLQKAGFGEPEHPHGNTLLGMAENCLEQIASLKDDFEAVSRTAGLQADEIATMTESRDDWKRQWRLMEAAEKKAEEQIAALEAAVKEREERIKELEIYLRQANTTETEGDHA